MSGARSGLVAVLFTDLVGSTELMTQLGDRAFDDLRRQHFGALGRAVAAHGGEEVKNTGDGLMAVFPSAAEAVEAAVAMQQATARQAKTAPLAIRVGVAVGDAAFEAGDYFGTPVVEAARLVAAARPGQILATQIARTLAGTRCSVPFTDLGPQSLKGLPEPVAVCEVGWQPAGSSVPMPALLTDVGRIFVGRDAELERLAQLWKEAAAGERRIALLAGEPGVGKTRLAAEVAIRVHEQGAVVLAGRCDEDLGVPYQPFVEALRHFVHHTPQEVLKERLGRYGGELARLVPELLERVHDLPLPLQSDPETERYRLFDAVATWLSCASAEDPVLLVLDDLHWAAKPTLLLLRHVLRSGDSLRLLIIVTYRDSDIGRGHPMNDFLADLRRHSAAERLALSGLDTPAVAAFVEAAAGHSLDDDEQELPRVVWRETDGNPFFVAELLRHLAESRALEHQGGRWVLTTSIGDLGIPEGIRDVVGRRLSRLSALANRLLSVAAVCGVEFEPSVVEQAAGVDEDELLAALEEAAAARVVFEVADGRFRFAHALIRATLYDELSGPRRTALHRRVAESLETLHSAGGLDDYLPALAHHWARASAPAAQTYRAVDYATRAGDRAQAQLAHDEAVTYYRQALDLLSVGEGQPDEHRRLELLIALGEAQRRAGERAHRETLLAAARLARRAGDADALCRAALANYRGIWSATWQLDSERIAVLEEALGASGTEDSSRRAHLLAHLSAELIWGEDFERRVALADEAITMARRIHDGEALAKALFFRTLGSWGSVNVQGRLDDLREILSIAERLGDQLTCFWAWRYLGLAEVDLGDLEAGAASQQTCERLAEELGQPALQWAAGVTRVGRLLLAGALADAEDCARRTFELGQAIGEPDARIHYGTQRFQLRFEQGRLVELEDRLREAANHPGLPSTRSMFSLLCCELGQPDEARAVFEPLVAEIPQLAPGPWLKTILANTAAVCAFLDDEGRAPQLIDLLTPRADQLLGNTLWVGSGRHYLALLAVTLRSWDEAEAHFAAAEAMHERLGMPTWLARTRLESARMLLGRRASGDTERARDLLGRALGTARELGLRAVERQAVILLRAVP